jgi:hypothetical protein
VPSDLQAYERTGVTWQDAVRIQPWRYPEITIWSDLVDEDDLPGLLSLLQMTEPEVYRSLGALDRLTALDRTDGEGIGWVMPAFTFGGPGRFNDESFGCFYAARELETAVAETVFHQEQLLRATREPPIEMRMRVLHAALRADPCLQLGESPSPPALYHPTDYSVSQLFGATVRQAALRGIAFHSVRRAGGHCAALFHPADVTRCESVESLAYLWNGSAIESVEERSPIDWS